jgi:hypothetical protein
MIQEIVIQQVQAEMPAGDETAGSAAIGRWAR